MKALLNSFYCLLLIGFIAACGGGSTSSTPVASSVDLTGFTQTQLPGGGIKAVKKNAAGKIVEEGTLINGKRNGAWITYFDDKDDRIKSIANYVNDQPNGVFLTFSNRGQIETQTNYVNGIYDGAYLKYRFGNIEESATYVNGQMDGMFKQFYGNNKIKLEAGYKNGKQHGLYKYYDEDGKVMMEYEYNNGEKVSGGIK